MPLWKQTHTYVCLYPYLCSWNIAETFRGIRFGYSFSVLPLSLPFPFSLNNVVYIFDDCSRAPIHFGFEIAAVLVTFTKWKFYTNFYYCSLNIMQIATPDLRSFTSFSHFRFAIQISYSTLHMCKMFAFQFVRARTKTQTLTFTSSWYLYKDKIWNWANNIEKTKIKGQKRNTA